MQLPIRLEEGCLEMEQLHLKLYAYHYYIIEVDLMYFYSRFSTQSIFQLPLF